MEISVNVPDHVLAAYESGEIEEFALAALTDEAKRRVLAVASDDAQRLLREAAEPFEGVEVPHGTTVPERVSRVESDQVALRAQVRSVGVALATAAGVSENDAVTLIEGALAATPAESSPDEPEGEPLP